jgi:exocyst complex protein 7
VEDVNAAADQEEAFTAMVGQRHAAYAEEAAEVEVLYASLDKMKSVSKKIQGSMTRLDETGRTVQDAIGPIYGNTQRLQAQNMNIDRILAAIEKVKQPLDMRNKEERILRNRPDQVGLSEYIASIDRTNQALKSLKATNLRSNQTAISELSSLLAVGTGNLENVFRDMLRQDSQTIEPLKQITQGQEFPRISSTKSAQLRTINTNISNYTSQIAPSGGLTPSAKVYAQERGQYMASSLQNLATASISTARKVAPDATYKAGSCAITTYTTAIQGMYIAEYDNICPVFSRDEWGAVLTATCQDSLRTFASTLRDLDSHIRGHLLTDCYLAYEIVDVVSNTSFQIENHTGELKQNMSDVLKPVRETAKSSLSILLGDVRTKAASATFPTDARALTLTTDVMTRLQLMTSYLGPLSSIMRSLGDGGWNQSSSASANASAPSLPSFDVGADGKQLFAHYCMDTIEALLVTLEARGKQMQKPQLVQATFLANNVAIIQRMIDSSELQSLLAGSQPKLDAWKSKAQRLCSEGWRDAQYILLDVQKTSRQARTPSTGNAVDTAAILKGLSTKEKDAIKEKFKSFNTSFDDLLAKHKSYHMEPEARRSFATAVSTVIEPLYGRFWDRYHEIDKGKGKYVKYDKSQLSAILASLG